MAIRDSVANCVVGLHRGIFRASGGRLLGGMFEMPVLELTTIGAKSGKSRSVMLTSPINHEGNAVIIASKGGAPTNPDWYHNLRANPVVDVEAGGEKFKARATETEPAERERLWAKHVEARPEFAEYPEKSGRTIPVITLEKID